MRPEAHVRDMPFAGLQASLAGAVLRPGSSGYEAARRPANARFRDCRPTSIVLCHHAADVAETLRFARRSGWA